MTTPIQIRLEEVTPEKAVAWLDLGAKQRHYQKKHAQRLAGAILAGQWKANGETIKFDVNNHLIDGQHRLHAVYLAKKSIETYVARGLPEEAFDSIDLGRKRTVGDILSINGEQNATVLAAGINLIRAFKMVLKRECPPGQLINLHSAPMDAELFLSSYPKVRKSAEVATANHTKIIHPSMAMAIHWIYGQSEVATAFVRGMNSGFSPTDKNSQGMHIFREAMIANRMEHKKMRRPAIAALAIKGINAAIAGEKLKELAYFRDEAFPTPTTR